MMQKVVIVNGSPDMIELLEPVLEGPSYDMVFVEASDHAYRTIKNAQPDLVIFCLRIEDVDGFNVISMLKLDEATRQIPVLTYTTEQEGQEIEGCLAGEPDEELGAEVTHRPALRRN